MTFFIFSYIYVLWFVRKLGHRKLFFEAALAALLIACASVTSYVFSYFYLRVNNLSFNPGVAIINLDEIPQKIVFFISRPFVLAYRPFLIDSPPLLGLLVTTTLFILPLVVLLWERNQSIPTTNLDFFIFNIFLVLAITPLLVASENQIDMRFVASNTWLYVFVTSYLIIKLIKSLKIKYLVFQKYILFLVPGFLLLYGAFTINNNFVTLFHDRYEAKQDFFHTQLSSCSIAQIQNQVYIISRTIPWPLLPYIGAYSQTTDLQSSWVPIGAITQFPKEQNMPIIKSSVFSLLGQDSLGCEIKLDEYPNP